MIRFLFRASMFLCMFWFDDCRPMNVLSGPRPICTLILATLSFDD